MTLNENCSEAAQAAKNEKDKKKRNKKRRVFLELRFVNENRNCQVRGKAVTVLHIRTNLAPVSQLINAQEIGDNPDKVKELSDKVDRPNCQKIRLFMVPEENYPKTWQAELLSLCRILAASQAYVLI